MPRESRACAGGYPRGHGSSGILWAHAGARHSAGCHQPGRLHDLCFNSSLQGNRGPAQVATPGGMGLPAFYGPMLAPVTALAVTSLADFSARRALSAPSGATNEGLARQCFDQVCSSLKQQCSEGPLPCVLICQSTTELPASACLAVRIRMQRDGRLKCLNLHQPEVTQHTLDTDSMSFTTHAP